jgi:hypothetical protein
MFELFFQIDGKTEIKLCICPRDTKTYRYNEKLIRIINYHFSWEKFKLDRHYWNRELTILRKSTKND